MLTSEQSRHFNPAKFLEGNAFTNKKEEVTNLLRAQPKRFSQDLDKEKEDLTVFGNEMLNNANNRKDSLDNNINSIKSQTAEEYKLNILKFSLDSRLDQIKNSAEIKNFLQEMYDSTELNARQKITFFLWLLGRMDPNLLSFKLPLTNNFIKDLQNTLLIPKVQFELIPFLLVLTTIAMFFFSVISPVVFVLGVAFLLPVTAMLVTLSPVLTVAIILVNLALSTTVQLITIGHYSDYFIDRSLTTYLTNKLFIADESANPASTLSNTGTALEALINELSTIQSPDSETPPDTLNLGNAN